ncbi:MAG: GIY-YIG nuclease family protein [Candidatus Omnitrophota bacterium]
MYHVYLLRSKKDNSFYIGYANNLKSRLKQHNTGLVGYTKKYRPWEVIYYESFLSLKDAKLREKGLKHFGRAFTMLKKRIESSLEYTKGAG